MQCREPQRRRPSTGRGASFPLYLTLLAVYLVGLGQEQFAGDSGAVSRCRCYLRRFLAAKPSRNGRGVPTCRQETPTSGGFRHHAFLSPYHFHLGGSALNETRLVLKWALCVRLVGGFRRRKGERRGRDVPWTGGAIGFDQLGRGGSATSWGRWCLVRAPFSP